MSVNWRYWRLGVNSLITPSRLIAAVQFFKLTATAGGSTVLIGGTASASTEFAGQPASNAFSDDSTYWASSSGAIPAYLQYDLGSGNSATARFLEYRGYTPDHGFSPSGIEVLGSNDGATWTTLMSATILDYTTGKFVVSSGTIRIPFGYIVSGNGTHSDTTAVQRVFINDWTTGALIDSVVPDSAGNWQSTLMPTSDVLVTQVGDSGYQPVSDGPVTPAAR